ncbi:hypothetical protein R1flu_002391 [Riccia fluitans]|uniref:J domain-containing protein n=1 Tax=Riccia fluitans TaxID=41844 RepID=A0ABD1Y6C7_9MARC
MERPTLIFSLGKHVDVIYFTALVMSSNFELYSEAKKRPALAVPPEMASPLIAGLTVAVAAWAGKYGIEAYQAFKLRPATPRLRKFYEGGFQPTMTRREAALILGVRESVAQEKIKEAHRRVMTANHPDAGGSDYLAAKINEAKDHLLGQTRGSGSAF